MEAKISIAIVAFNEEKCIRDCLESVKWADEIIVVDSKSTDKTVDICREYTDKIIIRDWPGHVEQKSYATSQCKNNWVFSIDADERISPGLKEEVETLRLNATDIDCFFVPRKAYFMDRWIYHSSWYPDYKPRLFRKDRGAWEGINPHDIFITKGKTKKLKNDLYHIIGRNIVEYSGTIVKYADISARNYVKLGKRSKWHHITVRPVYTFLYKYFFRLGFLDGIPGLVIAVLSSYGVFLKYMRLRELRKSEHLLHQ